MDTTSLFGVSPIIADIAYQIATIIAFLICIGGVIRQSLPDPLPDDDTTTGIRAYFRRRWEYDLFFECLDVCASWSRWASVMVSPTSHEGFSGFFKALSDTRRQMERDTDKIVEGNKKLLEKVKEVAPIEDKK